MGQPQDNAINRVLKAWGLGSIDEPGTLAQMAYMVDGHEHYMTLLRACAPEFRRDMYEAMSPHLRFKAKPLEEYVIASKEHAVAAQLPVLDAAGNLQPYTLSGIVTQADMVTQASEVELWVQCHRCRNESTFYGERKADAIQNARHHGWAWNELDESAMCPECLDAMDA